MIAAYAEHNSGVPSLVWNPAPERLAAAPLRFLLDHWRNLAGNGRPPELTRIDPIELKPALGYIVLLEPIEGARDFRYRLYGSTVAGISGFDMTGKLVSEMRASSYVAEFTIATYRAVMTRLMPAYTERTPVGALRTTSWQRIALPFVDRTGAAARILAATVPIGRHGGIVRAPF